MKQLFIKGTSALLYHQFCRSLFSMSLGSREHMEMTLKNAFKAFLDAVNSTTRDGTYVVYNKTQLDTVWMRGREYCYSPDRGYYIWCNAAQYLKKVELEPISPCKFIRYQTFLCQSPTFEFYILINLTQFYLTQLT